MSDIFVTIILLVVMVLAVTRLNKGAGFG